MGTIIKTNDNLLVSSSISGYTTTIKVTTLGLEYGDDYINILTLNETIRDELETAIGVNTAAIEQEATSRISADSASAELITTLSAEVDDNYVELISTKAVVAGQFDIWDGISIPLIGNIKFIGDVQYQYLGGLLGELGDGWVRTDASAQDGVNTVSGWVATASSLVVDPLTGDVTGWQYGDGSGFDSNFTISADNIYVNGTTTFASSLTDGTTIVSANNISTGVIYNTGGTALNYTMKIDLDNGEIHIK